MATFYDQSGNGNHGESSGGVTSGRIGQSKWMGFDGSDDTIRGNKAFSGEGDFTLINKIDFIHNGDDYQEISSMRINSSNEQDNMLLLHRITKDDKIEIGVRNSAGDYYSLISDNTIISGKINFVVCGREGSNLFLYVNGIYKTSSATADKITEDDCQLILGLYNPDSNNPGYLNGKIYEHIEFNQALTQPQIQQLYYSNYN